MVAMEYLFGQNFALVMEIVDANPMTVLGKEDVDVAVGRIAMKLTLDIVTQTRMAIAQSYRLTAEEIIETT